MVKNLLLRYGLGFLIAWACWIAFLYFTFTEPELFTGEALFWGVLGHLAVAGGNVALIIHARQWWLRNRETKNKTQ